MLIFLPPCPAGPNSCSSFADSMAADGDRLDLWGTIRGHTHKDSGTTLTYISYQNSVPEKHGAGYAIILGDWSYPIYGVCLFKLKILI